MSGHHVLAIDQGTTGTTVLVFDREARVVAQETSEFAQHYPRPGWVEHDPIEILDVSVRVVATALETAGLDGRDIAAVGITNQRETVVMWDRTTGEPVAPAIVWQDRRTASMCDEIKADGHEELVSALTGLVVDPYFSGTKVRWLLEKVDGLRQRAEAGEIAFGTIDSWLLFNLSGKQVHATDLTNASRTLLFDIHEREWSEALLDLFGVPRAILPEVFASAHEFATTDPDTLCGIEAPIAGMAGDQQAALFGQACFEEGSAKNTYGTGSFVLMNTGNGSVAPSRGLLTTIAASAGESEVHYALEGAIFVTGAAVQWLRDGLGVIDAAAETEQLAFSVDGNDDVYFVPALTGLGCPAWDPRARGTIVGLTRGTSRAHLARATLESIAYQTKDVLDAMEEVSGIRLDVLRADGGACDNDFLMQFQADMIGRPVEVPKVSQTTALGAAYLAGLAAGVWAGRDELAARRDVEKRFDPEMSRDRAEALHDRWREALRRSLGWDRS
jgi:glycerol kinase